MSIARWIHRLVCSTAVLALPAAARGQSAPVVLTRFEIGESYYDAPPADIRAGPGWLGLYLEEGGGRLAEATVGFSQEADGALTVYRLTAEPAEPHLLLFGFGDGTPAPGPVAVVQTWPESLAADGETIELALGPDAYRVRLEAADPALCDAVIRLESGARSQRLYGPENAVFSCDEPHFSVDWAGDLDRDGRLDLVTSFSSKYSVHPRTLWLSGAAAEEELVGDAATFERQAR